MCRRQKTVERDTAVPFDSSVFSTSLMMSEDQQMSTSYTQTDRGRDTCRDVVGELLSVMMA